MKVWRRVQRLLRCLARVVVAAEVCSRRATSAPAERRAACRPQATPPLPSACNSSAEPCSVSSVSSVSTRCLYSCTRTNKRGQTCQRVRGTAWVPRSRWHTSWAANNPQLFAVCLSCMPQARASAATAVRLTWRAEAARSRTRALLKPGGAACRPRASDAPTLGRCTVLRQAALLGEGCQLSRSPRPAS